MKTGHENKFYIKLKENETKKELRGNQRSISTFLFLSLSLTPRLYISLCVCVPSVCRRQLESVKITKTLLFIQLTDLVSRFWFTNAIQPKRKKIKLLFLRHHSIFLFCFSCRQTFQFAMDLLDFWFLFFFFLHNQ